MKKALGLVLGAGAALTLVLTGTAGANTTRSAACQALAADAGATATYVAGNAASGSQDTCTVVSTSITLTESVAQVNNPRAAKAVQRVTVTENRVTTTQAYRWNTANANAGGQVWVAASDPITEEEVLAHEECMRTPGRTDC